MTALGLWPSSRLGLSPRQRRATTQAPPFSPATLSGLAFWYDAQQSPVIEAGGEIAQWNDLSGHANHAGQSESDQRPIKATALTAAM